MAYDVMRYLGDLFQVSRLLVSLGSHVLTHAQLGGTFELVEATVAKFRKTALKLQYQYQLNVLVKYELAVHFKNLDNILHSHMTRMTGSVPFSIAKRRV